MLPDNTLIEFEGSFLPPRDKKAKINESFDLGGIALSDTSEPFVYEWHGYVEGNTIYLARKDQTPVAVLLFTGAITELSITFDQNMRPTIAYVEDGIAKLYWYDSSQAQNVITEYDVTNPRVSLDDKRKFNIGNSDIIFAYIADGNRLCYRLQRERYGIDHELLVDDTKSDSSPLVLSKIGMSTATRFLFETN